jgi:hypothetical protein
MNKLARLVALSTLLVSSLALADTKAPKVTGTFRHAEVIKAVAPKDASSTRTVVVKDAKTTNSHVMMVAHDGGKVDFVNAPTDRSLPVHKMSTAQTHKAGLLTQKEAHRMASQNGGEFGQKGAVTVQDHGIAGRRNSFAFITTAHEKNGTWTVQRTVSPSTGAQTASPMAPPTK